MRGKITVASVLIGVAAVGACSDEDSKKKAKGSPDAGADGSLGGDGGSAGSSAGGTGASGGNAGTGAGGTGGAAGMDASAGTGGTAGSAGAGGTSGGMGGVGGMTLICNTVDAGATGGSAGQGTGGGLPDAAVAGAAGSAGTAGSGPVGQWRDWNAWQCRDCPAPVINNCIDLDLAGSSTFDLGTRIFTLAIRPGVIEVVSASYSLDWGYVDGDGGYQYGTSNGSFTVDKDTLIADVSSNLPAEVMNLYGVQISVTDACGVTTNLNYGVINEPDPDGGTVINIHCEGQ
ncbi:MAG: hypothetical protein AB7S68_34205 [Polyangiaceae bacterium]